MSALAKHTNGPWSVFNNHNSNYGLEVVADVKVKAKRVVCRVGGPDRDANARLIAAAPSVLAVLKAALAEHDYRKTVQVTLTEPPWVDAARAAISKAESI